MSYEPKIIAFCCHWCSYAAADMAAVFRKSYPPNLRIIRVMCSGMVHPNLVLEALKLGADGVMILGCPLGECHYQEGNYKALERAEIIKELLENMGYEPERVQIAWCSAAEADKFVEIVTKMTRRIKALGPNLIRSENT